MSATCKRRGRIHVGSQSVLTRCWYPSKQRDVGYEGCTKKEGEAICQLVQKLIAGGQEDQRFPKVI
jgi:hypothetical protein